MGLETGTYISDLVVTNPLGSDAKSTADDHLRLIKSCLKTTFPSVTGAVTKTHTELNSVTDRGLIAGQTWTGTHTLPATTYGVTATLGDSSLKYATTEFVANTAFSSALPAQLGNSGKLLTTNGTIASWTDTKTVNGNSIVGTGNIGTGLVPLAVLTPTAAANVDFLSTFSSSYDSYLIVGTNINSNSGSSDQLFVRLANAGAVDTSSNYANSSSIGTAFSTTGTSLLITSNVLAAGKGVSFSLIVKNVNSSSGLKAVSVDSQYQTNATPSWRNEIYGHMYIGGTVSGVRFYWSAGVNFIAQGSIKIYGIQN
jgi:hypothetical protein